MKTPVRVDKRQENGPNKQNQRYGGKLPKNWLPCPDHGGLIDDFILPIKARVY